MNRYGMVRVSTLTPVCHVADPARNAAEIVKAVCDLSDSDIIVTPELSITGYTCGDLFASERLLGEAWAAVLHVAGSFKGVDQLLAVGCPVRVYGGLFNCAVLLNQGQVIGVVPKQYLPTYKEFYEARHFQPGDCFLPKTARVFGRDYPFGVDLLFRSGAVVVGVEVCEDLWVPLPPSSFMAVAGANVLLNLSASNETVGKSAYRSQLVAQQSARCVAAYLYCSAGPSESTAGTVFSGHNLIAENGAVVLEAERFTRERHSETFDIDVEKLEHDRAKTGTFAACRKALPHDYRFEEFYLGDADRSGELARSVPARVFVPSGAELEARCDDIFNIQVCGLAKRLEGLAGRVRPPLTRPEAPRVAVGVSGGLDSTLALIVAVKTFDRMGWPRENILGRSMPGFGTTDATRKNAQRLADLLRIDFATIDIRGQCVQMFLDLDHDPFGIKIHTHDNDHRPHPEEQAEDLQRRLATDAQGKSDLTFENVQARVRTAILMNTAFVLGTGDMSEAALGWCTYNADQQSMYNVNAGVPKTLVRFLVGWAADKQAAGMGDTTNALYHTLHEICDTAISPELLPAGTDGQIAQKTEDVLGPYELHDFFLFHLTRSGFSPEKIAYLARNATGFSKKYAEGEVAAALHTFMTRFFAQQYKRQNMPDGPKVGSVDLNPRGDWRMPPDASPDLWTRFDK